MARSYAQTYRANGHPVATRAGWCHVHRVRLYDAIGPGPHPCYGCGMPLNWYVVPRGKPQPRDYLEVDHADRDIRNNALANLRPACRDCNRNSARYNGRYIPDTELTVTDSRGIRLRAVQLQCAWCGTSFAASSNDARRGRRFCRRTCAMYARNHQ
jgi:hypothetical protein